MTKEEVFKVLENIKGQKLEIQIEDVSVLHQNDIVNGYGSVYLPFAFDKKSPKAKFETKWQYLFPMTKVSKDPN